MPTQSLLLSLAVPMMVIAGASLPRATGAQPAALAPTPVSVVSEHAGLPPDARRFTWADSNERFGDGACLTVTGGLSPAAALRIVAPHARSSVLDPVEAQHEAERRNGANTGYFQVVYAVARGGRTLVLEDNGFAATEPAIASEFGRHAPTTVLFRNINALMQFGYADRRGVVRSFDPLLYDDGGRPLPQERGLPFGNGHPLALSMTLTERLLGYTTRPRDLDPRTYSAAVVVEL